MFWNKTNQFFPVGNMAKSWDLSIEKHVNTLICDWIKIECSTEEPTTPIIVWKGLLNIFDQSFKSLSLIELAL